MASAFVERQLRITIRVENNEAAFRWLERWLSNQPDLKKARTVSLNTLDSFPEIGADMKKVFALVPGFGFHTFKYKKKRIFMYKSAIPDKSRKPRMCYEFYLLGRHRHLMEEILREAYEMYIFEERKGIPFRTADNDSWEYQDPLSERSAKSVVLADGIMDSLITDLNSFFADKQWYTDLNIPHRRGVLLYGPPGSGKTSTVLAIASELKCKLYWIPISASWMSDTILMKLLMDIPAKSILVLEDIDAAFVGREKGKDSTGNKNLTFSGLLNALDGVFSSQGRVVFMTTNHIEKLDPALIRPGRVDLKVEIGYPSARQRAVLFDRFFPGDGRGVQFAELVPENIGMCMLQEHLLRHRYSPDEAIASAAEVWGLRFERELVLA